jgi:hypothetical protein
VGVLIGVRLGVALLVGVGVTVGVNVRGVGGKGVSVEMGVKLALGVRPGVGGVWLDEGVIGVPIGVIQEVGVIVG